MAAYDFRTQRLFVEEALGPDPTLRLGREQSHYLSTVLRLPRGAAILLFNGRDGEWLARIAEGDRRGLLLELVERTRAQPVAALDVVLGFAPLKHARLDYMVQKAVEMGAGVLQPIVTRHTQVTRVNLERMRANAIEAAEQCGVLAVPRVEQEIRLDAMLGAWPEGRVPVFCDEDAPIADPLAALRQAARAPVTLLIGPEGGFSQEERAAIGGLPGCIVLSLGPRILRADTAAVAALALVQAVLGDWTG